MYITTSSRVQNDNPDRCPMVFDSTKLYRMDGLATKHIFAMPTSLGDTLTIASHFSDADNYQISTARERYLEGGTILQYSFFIHTLQIGHL